MDIAELAVARSLRKRVERGELLAGTILYMGEYAPHLTDSQGATVVDALCRTGYATETDPPKVRVPLAVTYTWHIKAKVLPNTEIQLGIPLLAHLIPRADDIAPSVHEKAVRQALLILLDEGLVVRSDRKFYRQ